MIVNPGIRRFLGSAIQRLFNSASVSLPLTHTAIPTRGDITPSFTRATTSTWKNNDGYLVTGVAGEIGFVGARRVRNLLTFTEDLTNAVWTKTAVTASATSFVEAAVSSTHRVSQAAVKAAAALPYIGSVSVKPNGRNWCAVGLLNTAETAYYIVWVNLLTGATGTVASAGFTSNSVVVTLESDGHYRISLKSTTDTAANLNLYVYSSTGDGLSSYLGDVTKGLYVTRAQLEDVTSQTTQTAGEYVSVGVPSDWAGDELVTNGTFATDTTGWSTAVGATLSIDTARLKITNDGTGANAGEARQTLTTVVGTKYVLAATGTTGSAQASIKVGTSAGAQDLLTNSLCNGFNTYTFTATSTTSHLTLRVNTVAAGAHVFFDNISVKPAYYHGSFVDGVKCYATDINGSPIPSSTLLGYQAQGARTNLCLQSNAFTTTWTNSPALSTLSQNVIGPDGAVSAWTCADTDAANTSRLYQSITLTAAAYTASLFVKKTSGATSFPVIALVTGTVYGLATLDTNNGVATAWTANGYGTTLSGVSARCSSFNSDFWRFELTATGTAAAYTYQLYPAVTTNATQSTGVIDAAVTGSAVFYGAQVELGSFASSYIATTTVAVTRNADVLIYSSAGNIDGTKGWCYAEFDVSNDSDGNQNIILGSDVAGVFPLYAQPSLGNVRTLDGTNAPIAQSAPMTGVRKGAGTWGGSTLQCAHNGVVSTTTAFDGNMNVTSVVRVGEDNAGNSHLFGTIRNVRIGQRQLSASELQAITS